MIQIDKIFILHYPKLTERKERLLKKTFLDDSLWIEGFNPGEQYERSENSALINRKPSLNEVSLYLKHEYAINYQIENKLEYCLYLEDDIIIEEKDLEWINNYINIFKYNKGDILWLGKCCGLTAKEGHGVWFGYTSRCTHCYVLSLEGALKSINDINKIDLPIDFKWNEIIENNKLKSAWTEPALLQGTDLKIEKSSIQL